jgi:hypothetical protein
MNAKKFLDISGLSLASPRSVVTTHSPLSRRDFIARAALFAASAPLLARPHVLRRAGPAVRIAVVSPSSTPTDARNMGLLLGAEEAMHAASLFGGTLELVALPRGDLHAGSISAIIGDDDHGRCLSISTQANAAGIPFFNVGSSADDLRGADCRRTTFHVAASDAMCHDAVAMANGIGTSMSWHPSLHRFGADTLNKRFTARFAQPMTPASWTAWLATKMLWESALAIGSGDAAKLVEHLSRDTIQFDGHKGLPLSFRDWDHQLRQPVYVVDGTKVAEFPVALRPDEPARALLDRLGTRRSDSLCHLGS